MENLPQFALVTLMTSLSFGHVSSKAMPLQAKAVCSPRIPISLAATEKERTNRTDMRDRSNFPRQNQILLWVLVRKRTSRTSVSFYYIDIFLPWQNCLKNCKMQDCVVKIATKNRLLVGQLQSVIQINKVQKVAKIAKIRYTFPKYRFSYSSPTLP